MNELLMKELLIALIISSIIAWIVWIIFQCHYKIKKKNDN